MADHMKDAIKVNKDKTKEKADKTKEKAMAAANTDANTTPAKTVLKRPSAAMDATEPKKSKKVVLTMKDYPGIEYSEPKKLQHLKLYTSPNSKKWRVKPDDSLKDKAFSWAVRAPKVVWQDVCDYVNQQIK